MVLKTIKLKYYCNVKDGTHDTPQYVKKSNLSFPFVTTKDISKGKINFSNTKHISKENHDTFSKRSNVEKNDILMPMIGTIGQPALVKTNREFSIKNVALFKTSSSDLKAKYLYYILSSKYMIEQLELMKSGGVQSFISLSMLKNLNLIVNENEHLVVKFLDSKISQIDAFISDKERLIELLEEKRQAVITETVTKGLDPNVKMKDSGIEWIGEVPEHWKTVKIKYLTSSNLIYGANVSAEQDNKNLPRYIRITDIDKEGFLKKETYKSLPLNIALKYPVEKGDLLFARSGASVGKTYLHQTDEKATYAGYLIKYRSNPEKINEKFLYYFTYSYSYKKWIKANTIQATIENVSAEKYKNLQIPYPKLAEQDIIVEFLEKYIKDDTNLVASIKLQISKLKEYRESLIYEAVTGKIDVRDYAVETEEVY